MLLQKSFAKKRLMRITSLILPALLLLAACAPAAQPQPTQVPPQPTATQPAIPTPPQPTAAQPVSPTQPQPTAAQEELPAQTVAAPTEEPAQGGLPVTGAAVQITDNAKFGQILADPNGMTLYTFAPDTPTESKCVQSDCVAFWPPYLVQGQPAADAALPGKLSTITRPDGSLQLAYNGHPLYTFKLDQNPGDANGDGINQYGGVWHVAPVSGEIPNTSGGNVSPTSPPLPDNGYNDGYSY